MLKRMASVYYLALISGYNLKEDIIKWADETIENSNSVISDELIELSLSASKSKEDVAKKLLAIFEGYTFDNPQRIIYGFCLKDLRDNALTYDDVASILYLITTQNFVSIPEEELNKIMHLSDGFYLATECIYGNVQDVEREIFEFLQGYKEEMEK
ncbi:hypothetical protein RBH29_10575 [Herbivorax sp. ANBcel31]|uniref:hypothetical protein n=1 Tax=Herbivorax sp. ANBcel31 TaxID=3069754 RepID=UPI0027AF5240|nr:hypothetical protein [Herbivorax sp. ANBcel31]MDQ2086870.1 hypothetical protein [Herbivorax sp. ANBcel31]